MGETKNEIQLQETKEIIFYPKEVLEILRVVASNRLEKPAEKAEISIEFLNDQNERVPVNKVIITQQCYFTTTP